MAGAVGKERIFEVKCRLKKSFANTRTMPEKQENKAFPEMRHYAEKDSPFLCMNIGK